MFATQSAIVYKQAQEIARKKKIAGLRRSGGTADMLLPEMKNSPFSVLETSAWTMSDEFSTVSGGSSEFKDVSSASSCSRPNASTGRSSSSAWDDDQFTPSFLERCKIKAEAYLVRVIKEQERVRSTKQIDIINDKELIRARVESGCNIGIVLAMNNLKKHECAHEHCNKILIQLNELLHHDIQSIDSKSASKGQRNNLKNWNVYYKEKVQKILTETPVPQPNKTYTIKADADTIAQEAQAVVCEF